MQRRIRGRESLMRLRKEPQARSDYRVTARGRHHPKESAMRVSPYYSINPTDPDVHHVHDDCPSGQQIPDLNKRSGTNNWPLCKHCRDM
jgi:hypothetical protein|nr:hypothetical protein GCM10025699_37470 [Microbacterium flavescens]